MLVAVVGPPEIGSGTEKIPQDTEIHPRDRDLVIPVPTALTQIRIIQGIVMDEAHIKMAIIIVIIASMAETTIETKATVLTHTIVITVKAGIMTEIVIKSQLTRIEEPEAQCMLNVTRQPAREIFFCNLKAFTSTKNFTSHSYVKSKLVEILQG